MTDETENAERISPFIAQEKEVIVDQSSASSSLKAASDIARGGTGPRTHNGKQRSKVNATTHGIFSSVVILKSESTSEYESLLDDLRNDFRPAGRLEETLVEKLAVLLWRLRRLLKAEAGEIGNCLHTIEYEAEKQSDQAQKELSLLEEGLVRQPLIEGIAKPEILKRWVVALIL